MTEPFHQSVPDVFLHHYHRQSLPHPLYYTAEVVLYVALITLSDSWGISTFLLMTMVLMNLGLSATMTQRWYLDKFEDYPKRRWAMIPGIF